MTSTKMTIAAKKQWVINQLDARPRNVELAVMAIFNRQTADEQRTNSTNNNNSMGFNGTDAEFGSSLAKSIVKYGKLSEKQAVYARKIIGKYWKQLIEVAETKRATTGKGGAPWVVVATIEAPFQSRYDNDPAFRAQVDAEEDAKEARKASYEYGCPGCGCPEHHDGEYQLCPARK